MQIILWRNLIYQSLEYLKIDHKKGSYLVESTIIGSYKQEPYKVTYELIISKHWNINKFKIISAISNTRYIFTGKRMKNQWEINGVINSDFNGFDYIDISLTPFTNRLPINHLPLKANDSKEITAIYIDVLNHKIKTAHQRYTKVDSLCYLYENVEDDFKAHILIDEKGFVENYSGLFDKIAMIRK